MAAHKLSVGKGWNRRPTKLGLATRAKFDALVIETLRELGAAPPPEGAFPTWVLATRAGPLNVTPLGNWIACRFDDVEAAKKIGHPVYDLNQYSGKWNHHYNEGAGEREVINFKAMLRAIL